MKHTEAGVHLSSADLEGLELIAKLHEASGKEAERILNEVRDYERRQAYMDGFADGVEHGRELQSAAIRELIGAQTYLPEPTELTAAEPAWERYAQKRGIKKL